MKQMTFADAEYAGKRKQTRRELFLIEMDQVVPWLIALIEPHYPGINGVSVIDFWLPYTPQTFCLLFTPGEFNTVLSGRQKSGHHAVAR